MDSKNMQKIRENQIDKYWYTFCEYCWINNWVFSVHHIVYRSEAPRHNRLHDLRNLIICCWNCHRTFHDRKSNRNEIVKKRWLEKLFNKSLIIND